MAESTVLGQMRELVLIPKHQNLEHLLEGLVRFEVEQSDSTGVQQLEMFDDVTHLVREGQQQKKFDALANANHLGLEAVASNAKALKDLAFDSTKQEEQGDSEEEGAVCSSEESDDSIGYRPSSLIGRKAASSSGASRGRGGSGQSPVFVLLGYII